MSKNVLIISTTARKGGNSELLAQEFAKGAKESGNQVKFIRLYDKSIAFCKGCLACQKTHKCVINDDAIEIAQKMHDADVIVYATPVYYYSISGQLKTMFDRANSLYDSEYAFGDIYLLATAADDSDTTFVGAEKAVQGWIDCYERASLKGTVFAGGVEKVGDIKDNATLTKAYNLGLNV